MELSTIRAFQKVCVDFTFKGEPTSFSEDFARKRYLKKMQKPDISVQRQLTNDCWSNWIEFDENLPLISRPSPIWYRVRNKLYSLLRIDSKRQFTERFRLPKGSEFAPTNGRNSLESRLCSSVWTCTYDNFELYSKLVYNVHGLRHAAKRRFKRSFPKLNFGEDSFLYDGLSQKSLESALFRRFSKEPGNTGFLIFQYKLSLITKFEHGSRFSTVPKNNEKRRPINVECFGNTLTQSCIGEGIREILLKEYSIDLDCLSDIHRLKVSKPARWATIDLSNASDSVSVSLCEFLFPKWFMRLLNDTRSEMVLGLDGNYHFTRKISSMGNGFTFELMTLILTVLSKELDVEATVFGDDITIAPEQASSLILALEEVGFVVNVDKTFIDGPFRESCGANYHSQEGYIQSFDFEYPESIGDCVLLMNKSFILSRVYPSFMKLYHTFLRVLPNALHGGCPDYLDSSLSPVVTDRGHQLPHSYDFPAFFITPKRPKDRVTVDRETAEILTSLCYDPSKFSVITGFEFKSALRTPTVRDMTGGRHWAKYLMYLDAGRVTKDVISRVGEYKKVYYVTDGRRPMRISRLKPERA